MLNKETTILLNGVMQLDMASRMSLVCVECRHEGMVSYKHTFHACMPNMCPLIRLLVIDHSFISRQQATFFVANLSVEINLEKDLCGCSWC